jgi:UDP-MurNAc hydroxylase
MQMVWVNHASFLMRSGTVSLLCDPWLDGTTFNKGWSLLSPTQFSYNDFAFITHIWLSNARPDHFNLPTLMKIPEQYRRRIKILFHYTKDKRVVNHCSALGFPFEEFPEGQSIGIGSGVKLMSGMASLTDSWCAIFADGKTLLNMNGCAFDRQRELEKVKQLVGKVDVLLSQFSYSNWVGNPEDRAGHKIHAGNKLVEMSRQIQLFQPAQVIPSASYFYFSHAENFYMNQSSNRIGDVFHHLTQDGNAVGVVLYPGDHWELGGFHDSSESVRRYDQDLNRAMKAAPTKVASTSLERLQKESKAFFFGYMSKNSQLLLNTLPPAVVYLSDLEIHLELSPRSGLKLIEERQPDIILSSDSLSDCLTTDCGGETLSINGRFRVPPGGRPRRFFWIFPIPRQNGTGTALDLKFLGRQSAEKARAAVRGQ